MRMDPGLAKDCSINYTSPRIHTFRTSQDTGFFNCQDFVGTYTFFASGNPFFTSQEDPCSVVFLGAQKHSGY